MIFKRINWEQKFGKFYKKGKKYNQQIALGFKKRTMQKS